MITVEIIHEEWQSLLNEEKWVIFLDKFDVYGEDNILFISRHGQELGTASVYNCFQVHYKNQDVLIPSSNVAIERNGAVKEIYYEWCSKKNIRPNHKEGWFKSKKFNMYLDKIGYSTECNYVLFLTNIESFPIKEEVK